jgi:hypothetical protein
MSDRVRLLEKALCTINDINEATRLALDTLNDNAYNMRSIINELKQLGDTEPVIEKPEEVEDESEIAELGNPQFLTTEDAANHIVEQIKRSQEKGGQIHAIDISFDTNIFDYNEVMGIVRKKLEGAYAKEERDDEDDEFKFQNPID